MRGNFYTNKDGHVVWTDCGSRVTQEQVNKFTAEEAADYGHLCSRAVPQKEEETDFRYY